MAIIDKPSDFFNTILYTGNGNSGHAQTGVGFQPDFVWLKQRSGTEYHNLYDSVRGATKRLVSNLDSAETTISGLTSFNSDGFTVGAADTANQNSNTYVAWNWKAGTSFTNDASATGIGSIDSTGSVNTDAGFAIISYTATGSAETIAHGLGTTPGLIITKRRNGADSWFFWNKSFSATQYLSMDTTNAVGTASTVFGTLPTSTVYSTGGGGGTGTNGGTYISYLFAEKQGFSKFGSYAANENTNGPFIYTGFKPAFIILKQINLARDWYMYDNKRNTFNVINREINPNTAGTEDTGDAIDFLSNGFKIKTTGASLNDASGTYLYMTFAENPLVASNFVPATAR